ncbi:hypothetical protein F6V30_15515 [Oryzomonas sagensis]|uniref:Polysaccharide lyase-like protein n=1 Tax=Oryzomonas sagensis TaxID=2603857 RepID=A0ABQ6TKY4_9BACT|nr:hypothetical protein [Oryzomonas sagensis]KAB0668510.1 hypothetical protein F6V30_15515 [Oryzomonas sagensis]
MKRLLVIGAILWSSVAGATPSITSIASTATSAASVTSSAVSAAGTYQNGLSITIGGSGFTGNPSAGTANFESIGTAVEAGSDGAEFTRNNWSNNKDWRHMLYSTDTPHSGSKSLKAVTTTADGALEAAYSYSLPSGIGVGESIFVSYWVKVTTGNGLNNHQWKMLRFSQNDTIVDGPQELMFSNWGTYQTYFYVDPNTSNDHTVWIDTNLFPQTEGTWHRMDYYLTASSSTSASDGTVTVTHYEPGSTLHSSTYTGLKTHVLGTAWNFIEFQNYFGNGQTAGTVWQDDIYVQKGSQSRVELCDASTWASRKSCEIQPLMSWSAGSIVATVNQGGFASNATAYLYVVDSTGTANASGYPVTLGGSVASGPTAPKNLKATVQ